MIGYEQNWITRSGLYQTQKLRRCSLSAVAVNKLTIEDIKVACDETQQIKDSTTGYNMAVSTQGLEALLADMKNVAKHIQAQKNKEFPSAQELVKETSNSKKCKSKSTKRSQILFNFIAWLKKAAKKYKLLKAQRGPIETSPVDGQSLIVEEPRCQSLREVLNNKESTQAFRKFLAKELSEENLDFYLAVEDYKKQTGKEQENQAVKLFDEFIASCSPNEINVDCQVRKQTKENLQSPDDTTFDLAQRQIYRLMETDSFRRFSEQFR